MSKELYRIWFVPTLSSALAFYRMEQFVVELRKQPDIEIAYSYYPHDKDDTCQWEWNLNLAEILDEFDKMVSCADMMIFQAIHTQQSAALLDILKDKYQKPIFAEFDDDPHSVSASHPSYDAIAPGSAAERWSIDQLKMADGIICTTKHLTHTFNKYCKNTHIIPNCINFELWDNLIKSPRKDDEIRIGWAGGANHLDDLYLLVEPINYILDNYDFVKFVIFCGGEIPRELHRKGVERHNFKEWQSIDKYPQFMKDLRFDIGLAPLRDSEFNRNKSNIKWLEYAAMKIPAIVSPVKPYDNLPTHYADDTQGWIDCIETLINDRALLNRRGFEAYEFAKQNYDIKKVSVKYAKLLRKTIDNWEVNNAK